jgi:hypothetical protein
MFTIARFETIQLPSGHGEITESVAGEQERPISGRAFSLFVVGANFSPRSVLERPPVRCGQNGWRYFDPRD